MGKPSTSDHVYSALVALAITVVAIPFNPGIPWGAWVGAFVLLSFAAEVVCLFIKTGAPEGQRKKAQVVLYFSGVAALALIFLLVFLYA